MTTTIKPQGRAVTSPGRSAGAGAVTVTQYSRRSILAIWAAAALSVGALSWIVAPAIADGGGAESLTRPLVVCLTAGLIWQFVLAMGLVGYEQRSLRWSRLREALRLRSPRSPRTGRVGGRTWLIVIPLIVGMAARDLISIPGPIDRNLGEFLSSDVGKAMFDGSWGWFAVVITMFVSTACWGRTCCSVVCSCPGCTVRSATVTGWPTASCSACTTSTCPGPSRLRSWAPCSTPTPPSATRARRSASWSTASRTSSSHSSSSRSSSSDRRSARTVVQAGNAGLGDRSCAYGPPDTMA